MTLVGLLLSAKFPIAAAGKMFSYAHELTGLNVGLIPGLNRLRSFLPMFRGTELESLYPEAVDLKRATQARWSGIASDAVQAAEKALGRNLKAADEVLLYADDVNDFMRSKGIAGNLTMPEYLRPLKEAISRAQTQAYEETTAGTHYAEVAAKLTKRGFSVATGDVGRVRDYMSHYRVRTADDLVEEASGILDSATGASARAVESSVSGRAGRELMRRQGELAPSLHDLRLVADHFDDPAAIDAIGALKDSQGLGQYSLRAVTTVLPRYFSSMSRTYALTTRGYGQEIVAATQRLRDMSAAEAPNAKMLAHMMNETYLPLLQNDTTPAQTMWNLEAASFKAGWVNRIDEMLKTGFAKPGSSGERMLNGIKDSLVSEEGAVRSIGSKAVGLMTAGAMGGSLSSALQNLSSTMLLSTQIGPTATMEGIKETMARGRKYFALRGKVGEWEAWRTAFPDFVASGLHNDPLSGEVREMIGGAYDGAFVGGAKGALNKFTTALMAPFSLGETGQRLVAFHGARWKAIADELPGGLDAANRFAARMVKESQFTAGPASTPYALLQLPAPLKHFLSYPMRFVEQLGASTAWATGEGQGLPSSIPIVGGRNLGNVGRAMLATGLVEGAGRALGQDWSHYGFQGSLPNVREGSPFAPFPFVPPMASLLGAAYMDLSAGELNQLKRSAPMLVPGGLAASRAVGLVSPAVAQALGKEYTDWKPDAQGRYTLFDGQGRSRGQYDASQLYIRAAGLPVGDMQQEQDVRNRLIAQRDRAKAARKEYLRLNMVGDVGGAAKVKEGFARAFGFEMSVRPQDWDAARMQLRMKRNDALIGTMPKEMQPELARMARFDLVNSAYSLQDRGVDPSLLDGTFWQAPQQEQRRSAPLSRLGGFGMQQRQAAPLGLPVTSTLP